MEIDWKFEKYLNRITDPAQRQKILEKEEQRQVEEKLKVEKEQIVQLPLWPEPVRAIPNEIVRSALFNVRHARVPRVYVDTQPLVVIGDGTISYTGQELRQDDEDVWLQLLHMARNQNISKDDVEKDQSTVQFTPADLCKKIGWHKNTHYYNKLEATLRRLQATSLAVYSKRLQEGVNLSLVRKTRTRMNDSTEKQRLRTWEVWLEPEIVYLFGDKYYTKYDWEARKKLSPTAKWLHGYYHSHQSPYPVKIETIHSGCGSQMKELRHFKASLRGYLDEVKAIGTLKKWWFDKGKVYVER
jgi:hypothetical protein